MLKNLIKGEIIHPEEQYLNLVNELLEEGNIETGRNGDTHCNIGSAMYFSLRIIAFLYLPPKKSSSEKLVLKSYYGLFGGVQITKF